jgi:L-threonylcarbamoyladenylate synthase
MTALPFVTAAEVRTAIPAVTAHLAAGKLLAYPTETVYGLGSRPRDEDVARLTALKGRAEGKPFLLLIAGRAMAEQCDLVFTAAANALAGACWPGPLTLVLAARGDTLPKGLRGPGDGVAVRWTSHPGMAALIEALGYPITSTSANSAGHATATSAAQIQASFGEAMASGTLLVLDGGPSAPSLPSTIVDCISEPARLLREGALSRDELRRRAGGLAP